MKSIEGLLLALLTLSSVGLAQSGPWTQQTTGLPSGYVVFGLHAVDDSVVWGIGNASNASQSFIRTTNGGKQWTCSTINTAPSTYCPKGIFAFDANRAWVAMHDHSYRTGGGIFGTTDGGVTWKQDSAAFSRPMGCADFIYFFDENHGVCVGDPGADPENPSDLYFEIYTTSNGGVKWSRVPKASLPPLSGEGAIFGEFTGSANCLWFPTTGGSGRFIRTTDKGSTWSLHTFPNTASGWFPVLEFQDDNVGVGQGSLAGVMKTTDGGLTWNLIPNNSWLVLNHLEHVPHTPGMYVGASAYNGQSPSADWVWGTVITFDGGLTWINAGALTGGYTDLGFGSPISGWRTQDGNQNIYKWSVPTGRAFWPLPDAVSFGMIKVGSASDTVFVGAVNFGTDPVSVTSIVAPGGDFKIVQRPTLPMTLTWLQSANVALKFTPKAGGSVRDSLVVISGAPSAPRITVSLMGTGFASQPAKAGVLYAASGTLFSLNTTSGVSTRMDTLGGIPIHGLAIQPSTNELYGASASVNATTLYKIGSSSALTLPVCTFPVGDIRGIAFGGGDTLYAVTAGGKIYQLYAASGGIAFLGMGFGVSYMGLTISPGGTLLLSGSGSEGNDNIYRFDMSTGEATLMGRTGDNLTTPSIAFGPNGILYGLKGSGADTNSIVSIDTVTGVGTKLFSTGIQGLMAIAISKDPVISVKNEAAAGVPRVFALEQNYPNPFNPSTTIKFELPTTSLVTLSVYDLLGREVSVLVNERRNAGVHEVRFDASGLSSGVYFYRLQANDFVSVKKLLLLK